MPEDIRLSLSFRHHKKRRKVCKKLGEKGVLALIDFWCTVAEQNPTGILLNYTEEDVEIDAGWRGDSGIFTKCLVDEKFLDVIENGFKLHNWDIRQPWVFKSDERSDKSRFSRMAQTHHAIFLQLQAKGINAVSKKDYLELTSAKRFVNGTPTERQRSVNGAPAPAPVPTPTPVPAPKERAILFDKFWDIYDNKTDRKKCLKKFLKLKNSDIEKIFKTLPLYVKSTIKSESENNTGDFIPMRKNPYTYLHNESWNNEIINNKNNDHSNFQDNNYGDSTNEKDISWMDKKGEKQNDKKL